MKEFETGRAGETPEKKFERLISQNESLVYRVCRIYTRNLADRQDLYQEIVLQLWKSFGTFSGNSSFSTWLYRVALNTAITGFRQQSKSIVVDGSPDTLSFLAEEQNGDWSAEQSQLLWSAIEKLGDLDRAILALYLDDIPYEQMEDILGLTQGNLRVKISRIKDKLKQLTKTFDHGH